MTPGTDRWHVAKCVSADCAAAAPTPAGEPLEDKTQFKLDVNHLKSTDNVLGMGYKAL